MVSLIVDRLDGQCAVPMMSRTWKMPSEMFRMYYTIEKLDALVEWFINNNRVLIIVLILFM